MEPLRAMIFDLDGTLMNTIPSLIKTGNCYLNGRGLLPLPDDLYYQMVGNGLHKLFERCLRNSGAPLAIEDDTGRIASTEEQEYAKFQAIFERYSDYHVKPYPGIMELLDDCHEQGLILGVLTNKEHSQTLKVLEAGFGSRIEVFSHIQGAQADKPLKPDPTTLLAMINAMGIQPEDVRYLGDSDVDMKTAVNAGVTGWGAGWGFRTSEELKACGASEIFMSPKELHDDLVCSKESR